MNLVCGYFTFRQKLKKMKKHKEVNKLILFY